jgi:DNA-binding MarR family transcriptional regulator
MTRLVDGLERDGYVRRARDPADGRSVIVSALPRARAVLESARDRRVTLLLERLGSLDDAEWERIEAALAVLEPVLEG